MTLCILNLQLHFRALCQLRTARVKLQMPIFQQRCSHNSFSATLTFDGCPGMMDPGHLYSSISCKDCRFDDLTAVQAPEIMTSRNRQEARDRLRSRHDYRVNLKAELEIRHLHEKIDHLLSRQWERLVEIQQIQIDLMSEISRIRDRQR